MISADMIMSIVQVVSFILQIVQVVPDVDRIMSFYFEVCRRRRNATAFNGCKPHGPAWKCMKLTCIGVSQGLFDPEKGTTRRSSSGTFDPVVTEQYGKYEIRSEAKPPMPRKLNCVYLRFKSKWFSRADMWR